MRLPIGSRLVLLCLGLVLGGSASAQSAADAGIAGFWSPAFGGMPRRGDVAAVVTELTAQFPEGTIVLDDAGAVEFPPGEYGGLPVRAELVEAARDYDPRTQTTVSLTCRPPGLIYSMQGPFPMEIFTGRDMSVIKLEYFDLVRVVFMNQDEHPDAWPHSQTGHSIGRWEGDTLVVDTVSLQAGTLFNNGVDHTENVHLIERVAPAGPNTLIVSQQFTDPGSFDGTAARVFSFSRADDHVYPYDCDPAYGIALDSIEGPTQP
jgi:hypothetical protein